MPIIKSAKKKLRQDKKRTEKNKTIKTSVKDAIKKAKKSASKKTVSEAYSQLDRAVKQHVIHKNKAARLKSQLASANGKS